MGGRVRVLDESGNLDGFCTISEAERLVKQDVAQFTSDTRLCIQRTPPNPRESNEGKKGRLRIKKSGYGGPMTVQIESASEEFNS